MERLQKMFTGFISFCGVTHEVYLQSKGHIPLTHCIFSCTSSVEIWGFHFLAVVSQVNSWVNLRETVMH